MSLVAEYEVGCEALPLTDVARAVPAATLRVQMVPHAKGNSPFVVRIHAGPPAVVEDAFDDSDFVAEYSYLGTEGDGGRRNDVETRRYQVIPAPDLEGQLGDHVDDIDGLRALSSENATFDRIAVTPEGWRYTGRFADRATFDTFREFWQSEGYPFRLHRLTREGRPGDGNGRNGALTDRQRAAVRTAYELGYFEIPRNASLDDVASELDISASSCSERLRRAQTALLEAHVDLDGRRQRDPPRPGT
jgi:hypothetical protein